ncbi:type I methionyl aminopeptidase [Brachyspira pilosicoli]|uniref:type I methionyl aminopeptidase n=1 Tax=Brachyspira pilosicoli TaxID=52584 RepID=UPI0012F483F3|nr:type I methionyl aminopeptidase [Brachyspira pilosicoli]
MFIKSNTTDIVKPSIKDEKAIENIKKAAQIAQEAIDLAFEYSLSGTRASKIDKDVEKFIKSKGAYPANLEVPEYGFSTSISIGNEIAHGRPTNKKILVQGDIICIDIGVKYNGYYADCARTMVVKGNQLSSTNKKAYKLIKACKESLEHAIYKLRPNILLSTYGKEVEKKVNEYGYSIIKSLTGHGVGYEYHEAPYIYNFYHPNNDVKLEENMVLALELMITEGSDKYIIENDGWTISTADYSFAAHFEHTVLIKKNGVEILGID